MADDTRLGPELKAALLMQVVCNRMAAAHSIEPLSHDLQKRWEKAIDRSGRMADTLAPDERCLFVGCTRPRRRRGLCHSCYGHVCWLIQQGRTTWVEEEKAGRCLPLKRQLPHVASIILQNTETDPNNP